ncbi:MULTISPECIES: helix-turn-helix domain-containing protein [Lachnospiraceae]|uniref:Transcriptional regulator n=1 Tax=Mediterraneibacter gnavus TaxID=33038 RepID=A0A2N5PMK3_MEDGN|nr:MULTISPECIES: helix-turn-helix transcriptional regulator [Lachnospiraceae]PLT76375.1 transcriptional regulator [Mediterraneibacter gnavus]
MSEFEKQVKKALIDRNMTMGDLAEALGISLSYVSDLIKEKRNNEEQIARIKDFLNLSDAGGSA